MKLDNYEFGNLSRELTDFKDDLLNIVNFGKMPLQIVNTVPSWAARNGETAFYSNGNDKRWFVYFNNTWNQVSLSVNVIGGWVSFSGTGTVLIKDSFNVTSITDVDTAEYAVNWTNTFNSSNYAVVSLVGEGTGAAPQNLGVSLRDVTNNPSQAAVRIRIEGGNFIDSNIIHVLAVGAI